MSLAGQWSTLGSELPVGWNRAELRLELRDREPASRAASLLGPAQPFRAEPAVLRLTVTRDGTAVSPDNLTRLLRRVDEARIGGALTLAGTEQAPARAERDSPSTVAVPSANDAIGQVVGPTIGIDIHQAGDKIGIRR